MSLRKFRVSHLIESESNNSHYVTLKDDVLYSRTDICDKLQLAGVKDVKAGAQELLSKGILEKVQAHHCLQCDLDSAEKSCPECKQRFIETDSVVRYRKRAE